jgi:multiple sugar transport system substrate-binding protein
MKLRYSVIGVTTVLALLTGCSTAPSTKGNGNSGDQSTNQLASDTSIIDHAKQFKGDSLRIMMPEPLDKWFAAGTKTFEKETGVNVNFEVTPFDQLLAKYSTLAVGQDSSVDMFYSWSGITAQMGPLLFEDLTTKLKTLSKEYTPGSLSAMQSDGVTYGLPYMTSIQIMYYNRNLFKAAGLDPDTPPTTWGDFVTAAKAITATGNGVSGFVTGGQTANDVFAGLWLPAFNSAGGSMYASKLHKVTINSPEGLRALQALSDLGASGAVTPQTWSNNGSQDAAISFARGKVGMTFNFPLAYPIIADPAQSKLSLKDLGMALIPGVTVKSGSVDGSEGFAINRSSKNKSLSLDYLAYITGPTVQKELALGTIKTIPSRSSLLEDSQVVRAIPAAPFERKQAVFPADRAGSPFYNDVAEAVAASVRKVMQHGADPKSTLSEMQSSIQKIADDYWSRNG